MKYVTDKKRMATAIMTTGLTVFCFAVLLFRPDQVQFFSTGIILIPIAANTWLPVFIPQGEQPVQSKALRIANIVLDIACLIAILAYTLLRSDIYIWIALGCSLLLCATVGATIFVNIKVRNK